MMTRFFALSTLRIGIFVSALCGVSLPVAAQDTQTAEPHGLFGFMEGRRTLGVARAFSNDYLGDGEDRWQTGSYSISVLRGYDWRGVLPDRPFEIIEYRLATAITAPSSLSKPPAGDRRYAGRLGFSASTYWQDRGLEGMVGFGLNSTGDDNGIGGFQDALHNLISAPKVRVRDDQIGNGVHPFLLAEAGKSFDVSGTDLRLFSETRAGDENLVRAGVDWQFGSRETGALWVRDEITGHRVVGISGQSKPGAWFTLGADIAHVWKSVYLPSDEIEMRGTRVRARAGVNLRHRDVGIFYGLTWLSKEFDTQSDAQVLGTVRARISF
jgi:hypothetical protein